MSAHDQPDRELSRRFQAQRVHDEAHIPPFSRVAAGTERRPTRRLWWPVFATAAAAVLLVGVWRSRPSESVAPYVINVGEMRGPTDFLLDMATTGTRAGEMPVIGDVNWYPLPQGTSSGARPHTRRNEL